MNILRDWSQTGSVLVMDIKGELYAHTARYYDHVYRIDLENPDLSDLWNPLPRCLNNGELAHSLAAIVVGYEPENMKVNDSKPLNPKHLTYEVFGPAGTVANISYFDANSEPTFVKGASLPWSLNFELTETSAVGSILAQGDSDSIGCRILVDDEVKAEKISNQYNAFTSCLLKAA